MAAKMIKVAVYRHDSFTLKQDNGRSSLTLFSRCYNKLKPIAFYGLLHFPTYSLHFVPPYEIALTGLLKYCLL